jgi:hypothetical protein
MRRPLRKTKNWMPVFTAMTLRPRIESAKADVCENEICDSSMVIEIELRQARRKTLVARDGDDVSVMWVKRRLADALTEHLELRDGFALESLYQYQVTRR